MKKFLGRSSYITLYVHDRQRVRPRLHNLYPKPSFLIWVYVFVRLPPHIYIGFTWPEFFHFLLACSWQTKGTVLMFKAFPLQLDMFMLQMCLYMTWKWHFSLSQPHFLPYISKTSVPFLPISTHLLFTPQTTCSSSSTSCYCCPDLLWETGI